MIHTLVSYLKLNKQEINEIKEYFEKCSKDIDRNNLFMLRRVCMYTSIVYLTMAIIAKFIVPGFSFNPGHIMLIPILFIYLIINMHTRKNPDIHGLKSRVICLVYYFLMSVALIGVDLFTPPSRPVLWFPLVMMVFPVLYIDRQYKYGLYETFMVLFYCAISFFFEPKDAFIRDLYMVIAAYVLSLIISRIILGVRCKEGLAMVELRRFKVDKLTNVLNKGALIAEIDSYLKHREEKTACAMCIFDVDDFKQVNDGIGHTGGDALLERIGELLIHNFRPTDIIGRFGGDEFVVFMPGMKELSLVEFRCKSLQMMLDEFTIGDTGSFTLSVGAIVDEGGHSQEEMFRMADDALYNSKLAGKNRCSAWVVKKDLKLKKPGLVFMTSLDEENAHLLLDEESPRFDILTSNDNDETIGYISQYYRDIKLVVIELNDKTMAGDLAIRYIKEREIFSSIPVLAVVETKDAVSLAKELGADRVLMTDEPNEIFSITITELSGV